MQVVVAEVKIIKLFGKLKAGGIKLREPKGGNACTLSQDPDDGWQAFISTWCARVDLNILHVSYCNRAFAFKSH